MAFTVVHRDGTRRSDPPLSEIPALLGELGGGGGEIAVRHASGWIMRVHGDGVIEFGNDLDRAIRGVHRGALAPDVLAELLTAVAVGSFYETLEHEWVRGPRPPHPA